MNKHLSIFNFKIIIKVAAFFICFNILFIFIDEYITKKSEFRLNRIFSGKKINNDNIILGNSRSVPLNYKNIQKKNVENLSYNALNYESIYLILSALKKSKNLENKKVFINITSLVDGKIDCSFVTFYNYKFFNKSLINENCLSKKKRFIYKYIPILYFNSDLYLRKIYYFLLKKNDQEWSGQNKILKNNCNSKKYNKKYRKIYTNQKELSKINIKMNIIKNDFGSNIYFFYIPAFNNSIIEHNIKLYFNFKKEKKFISNNMNIEKFSKDCRNFIDTLHLSENGAKKYIIKSGFLSLFK